MRFLKKKQECVRCGKTFLQIYAIGKEFGLYPLYCSEEKHQRKGQLGKN